MKKCIKYKLVLLLIPAFFYSCEDSLKLLPPDGTVKDEYWKRKEEVKSVLMGAYKMLATSDDLLFYYGELKGDMLEADVNLSNELRDIMNSTIYPTNEWTNWKSFYSVINYCNSVLKYSPEAQKIEGPAFTDYLFNLYNAEAVFLRSLSYFYLVRVFKDVPFILEPYDTDEQDFFPAKTDGDVIVDSLFEQLNRILPLIPEEHETDIKTRGRATRGSVHALLADIALWKFDYQACIDNIEYIEKKSELYDLIPGGNWFTIFSDGNTFEGIFELQFNSQLGQDNDIYDITDPQSNNLLASAYAMQILSPKISKDFIRGSGSVTEDKLIWKYLGQEPDGMSYRSGTDRRSCNWIVYRMADVLLMKAEALSQLGNYDEAIFIINRIRERAFLERITAQQNPNAFEDLILEERARELAFEGKRWFDLLRMGRRNNFERKANLIEIIIENVPATQKRVLATKLNDPYGWYLPIYENELENNINLVQNPYYQIYEDFTQ